MDDEKEYIPVTVDKSHIIMIGERLYPVFHRDRIGMFGIGKFASQTKQTTEAFIEKEKTH